ncbi:tyrosine-protein kinase receptor Tie-1-like [Mercenaria mercenaria]|uniref:tyrosine-protein kinase receptor Tie-1-like n=1 Tax=Mercenaria mercenaria TaxID=6596 RepID=UPI00234E7573|nr:tyrosine-protein kinase receptor Tie-1-like [Mercenaria mercenaria]
MRERCFGKIFNYVILCMSLVSGKDADTNLITKLEGVLKTNMSSVAFNWTSENAVDGNVGPDPEQCLCCSGTTYNTISWWTVDLGKKYPIEKATIYSRETENKFGQLQGFQLFLRNSSEQTNQLYYDDSTTTETNTSVFDIFLSNVLARYLTIQKAGILTICEIEVFEGDCMIGTFGEECSKQCHCADNRICDRFTGQCSTPVCKIGWIGTACDTKCEVDAFGENCGEKCYCAGNTTCTIDYGICPDNCRKGYFGTHCNKVCPDGAFGTNCNDKCFCDGNGTCSKDEGICPGACLAGYMGVHCNIAEKEDKLNLLLVIGVSAGGGVLVIVAIV